MNWNTANFVIDFGSRPMQGGKANAQVSRSEPKASEDHRVGRSRGRRRALAYAG